ncbi:hypothetical protein H9X81_02185 [Hydrogenoanaerobacterium saccharovorans]|uniref:Uncharacterized protein n=1 Tax=Hydrogenoanaerobacterium saccharovorans TaxID=474960 RepID=A0ABS2GLB3_9FIRM|nr:hypothetical protein [Hydrogenoanaerobacterium saccharovorans]MBM6922504.1 hypothetical protein [Hydrogenoanaerobacterium saccharovorans]
MQDFPPKWKDQAEKAEKITEKLQKGIKKGLTKCGGGYNGLTATDFQSTGKFVDCFTEKFLGGKQT